MTSRHNIVAGGAYSSPTRTDRTSGSSPRDLFDACRNGDLAKVSLLILNIFVYYI